MENNDYFNIATIDRPVDWFVDVKSIRLPQLLRLIIELCINKAG